MVWYIIPGIRINNRSNSSLKSTQVETFVDNAFQAQRCILGCYTLEACMFWKLRLFSTWRKVQDFSHTKMKPFKENFAIFLIAIATSIFPIGKCYYHYTSSFKLQQTINVAYSDGWWVWFTWIESECDFSFHHSSEAHALYNDNFPWLFVIFSEKLVHFSVISLKIATILGIGCK